jgi:hypothetical protein
MYDSLGGSNLAYTGVDDYYLGGVHSRYVVPLVRSLIKRSKEVKVYHFTNIVVLDAKNWKVVRITKPVFFDYGSRGDEYRNCIQDPISVVTVPADYVMSLSQETTNPTIQSRFVTPKDKEQIYLFTVNLGDHYSCIYEFTLNLPSLVLAAPTFTEPSKYRSYRSSWCLPD